VACGTHGHLSIGTIVAGTSFVINSSSNTDTSAIGCGIFEHVVRPDGYLAAVLPEPEPASLSAALRRAIGAAAPDQQHCLPVAGAS